MMFVNNSGLQRLCENDKKMNRPGIYARYKIHTTIWALAQLLDNQAEAKWMFTEITGLKPGAIEKIICLIVFTQPL